MIHYTITATKEWRIAGNGIQSDATMKGSAAQDYQNKAEIEYTEDGETVYREHNEYGICGEWKPTREFWN